MLDPVSLRDALADTERASGRFPEAEVLTSVAAQLRYLLDVAEGVASDSRLSEIVLGVQAAREVEQLDEALADKLHTIAAQVRAADASASRPVHQSTSGGRAEMG